ncbi:UDP-2,3-diacylglucosamine diphosphatase [Motiliproteus coralliicola]|uniref:UDP-2,3-diacylglucosamine hydrolase n=1 Tax=Motiliproteus coralliicola TaxID=2283196 RepID=A0A369WUJ9_9GAMM|nr:UDP-2,3-diacylglucosamine diphosphatase [Motiliproteus coralliicola]RDE24234.1 UDP-2,3-diacylglucosamine diphosphatase [Motiliproteus coralliicola]
MTTLFISDLHLDPRRPHLTRAFFDFLDTTAQGADALYILGDFFHLWLYEDPFTLEVADKLKRFSQQGTRIYLMHGNRDFLFGQRYCDKAGATLLTDPSLIDLYGQPTLLMHGDSLCLDDAGYQKYRRIIRSRFIFALQYIVPLRVKQRIANRIQQQSQQAKAGKSLMIMDVTPSEVKKQLGAHKVRLMIHGHTHRPATHQLKIDQQAAERIVLGDWGERGWYLRCEPNGDRQLICFDIPPLDSQTAS